MYKINLSILVLMILITACKSGRDPAGEGVDLPTGLPGTDHTIALPREILEDIIYSFSSIVEVPALIKDLGVPYSSRFLVSAGDISRDSNNFEKAFLMGVLGTDMGYMNMYGQTSDLPGFMAALRRLTDSLVLGHLFDFSEMERLAGSQSPPGSLMLNYMQGFNRVDEHLRQEERRYLSTAIVSGVWVEGLYLLTRAAISHPGEEIFERIGEQKIILNDLIIILRNHQREYPEFEPLVRKLMSLKEEFDKIEITYTVDVPQATEHDGMLVIVQNQRSTVNVTKEQISNITLITETIRDISTF